jgi:hypothetical protein
MNSIIIMYILILVGILLGLIFQHKESIINTIVGPPPYMNDLSGAYTSIEIRYRVWSTRSETLKVK